MQSDVCAIEWDGHQFFGVTISVYCYIFIVENFTSFDITLVHAYQRWQDGWFDPSSLNFVPDPQLVKLAARRVREHWDLYSISHGHTPERRPAFLLFYDPSHEVFNRRTDVDKLVRRLADALDMNRINRRV